MIFLKKIIKANNISAPGSTNEGGIVAMEDLALCVG